MRSHHAQARAFKVPVYLKPNLIGELTESKQPGMVLPQEQPRRRGPALELISLNDHYPQSRTRRDRAATACELSARAASRKYFSCVSESRVFVAAALKVGSGLFSCSALGSCQGAGALISGEAAMNEKLSHDEVSARGGKSKSPEKMRAVARNLELAKQALSKKRATAAKELLSAAGESRCARSP
jgi:hypothetical protein